VALPRLPLDAEAWCRQDLQCRLPTGLTRVNVLLTDAVAVLRDDPGTDTVQALGELALLEAVAGTSAADALTAETLTLGQSLAAAALAQLFTTRRQWLARAGWLRPEAAAYYREAVWLATQAGDTLILGRTLLDRADTIQPVTPHAAAS
jgi:hypothetical protein